MNIELKNNEMTGVFRTLAGYIHMQTEVREGRGSIESRVKIIDPVFESNNEIEVMTGFDQLVINFSNDKHVSVTTRNFGDPIGASAWRHIAVMLTEHILGTAMVKDGFIPDRSARFYDSLGNIVIDQLDKLAVFERVSAPKRDVAA